MPSPLFRNFQARRKAAKQQAKQLAASAKKTVNRLVSSRGVQNVAESTRRVVEAGLKQLGKAGSILGLLLKAGRATTDEALDVVNQALAESGQKAPSRPTRTPPPPTQRPEPTRSLPEPPEMEFREAPKPRAEPNVYEVMIGGRKREYSQKDPMITGEMIEVSSSNVYAIGFEFNWDNPMQGTLKVRFLQGKTGSKIAGPLYHYYNVHPDVFEAFKTAASKGRFVWDRLRIRGSVTGHRYRYKLGGIAGGYVPRQATQYGGNQYFIPRRFKGTRNGQIREFESSLPGQRRGAYRPANNGRPNNGRPN